MATGLKHAIHFAKTGIEVGKVTDAECGGNGVEGIAIIR